MRLSYVRDGLDELQEEELRGQRDALARKWKRQQHQAARQRGAHAPDWDVDQEVGRRKVPR